MRATSVATLVAAVIAMAGTGCGSSSGPSTEPIAIGAIAGLTGAFTFPEPTAAAKAVFDQVNKQGGIDGRKIEYTVLDDKGDPQVASQSARQLVGDKGVVALAGGASVVSCTANASYFDRNDVISIEGIGIVWDCFDTPNIAAPNQGNVGGTSIQLYYAAEVLKKDRVCAVLNNIPGERPHYEEMVREYERITGKRLALYLPTVTGNEDLTPYVLRSKAARCEAVVMNVVMPQAVAWLKAAKAQGVEGITWVLGSGAYADEVAKAVGHAPDLHADSEYEPLFSRSSAMREFKRTMADAGLPANNFALNGYVAAKIAVHALKSVEGAITRESVTEAMRRLTYRSELLGPPFVFGTDDEHPPKGSAKFVSLVNGKWVLRTPDWVTLPAS